jgi:hypothetical protein
LVASAESDGDDVAVDGRSRCDAPAPAGVVEASDSGALLAVAGRVVEESVVDRACLLRLENDCGLDGLFRSQRRRNLGRCVALELYENAVYR